MVSAAAADVKIVWDASTYSFIFQLTLPPGGLSLLDTFGLSLADSADTLAAFAASTPELGTPIKTFCAKISFVYDGPTSLQKEYHSRIKQTTTTAKANREADIQRMLFEEFACRRSTASFVPDVLAHAILTRQEFVQVFGKALSSTAKSTKQGILGTPKEIFDWISGWTYVEPINVDVILMEMMDFERTAPTVPRTTEFTMIHSLRSSTSLHRQAALRMMAEIALVRGKGVMPHDFHEGNGLATRDGEQLYLIDWGGLFYLVNPADLAKVLDDFDILCAHAKNIEQDEIANEIANAQKLAKGAKTHDEKKLARFPCLQDLCGFFQIPFGADRATNISNLTQKFQANLIAFDDFTCVEPNPLNVHRALTMLGFVDFMSNRMNFNYPHCQCGSVLSVVYPNQSASGPSATGIPVSAFDDFRTFLKTFAVDAFPANTRLPNVVAFIKEITQLCPSACASGPLSKDQLRPSWMPGEALRLIKEAEARRVAQEAEAKRVAQEAEARRLEEARILAQEAEARRIAQLRAAQEAELRAAQEAEARRIAEAEAKRIAKAKQIQIEIELKQKQAASAAKSTASAAKSTASAAKAADSRARLMSLSNRAGVLKPETKITSKQSALAAHQIQSAIAAQQEPQQPQQQEPAVPTGLLSKLYRVSAALDPRKWFKRQGGTRKHKNRNHQHNATKRRHK